MENDDEIVDVHQSTQLRISPKTKKDKPSPILIDSDDSLSESEQPTQSIPFSSFRVEIDEELVEDNPSTQSQTLSPIFIENDEELVDDNETTKPIYLSPIFIENDEELVEDDSPVRSRPFCSFQIENDRDQAHLIHQNYWQIVIESEDQVSNPKPPSKRPSVVIESEDDFSDDQQKPQTRPISLFGSDNEEEFSDTL